MRADIYWVTPRLAILARPRPGDWLQDEVASWREQGIEVVVSLLEIHEELELGLTDEAAICEEAGLHFVALRIADRGVPVDVTAVAGLVDQLANRVVGVHCRAGVGRSALFAACVLVAQGLDADEALTRIAGARGVEVPDTEEQREWVRRFALRRKFPLPGGEG